ncbi:MAG: PilZ domain-containing protein [Myxococcaceae bacterium]
MKISGVTAQNRRRSSRVRAKSVGANVQTDQGQAFCAVENLSEGGLFLRAAVPLPVGTSVTLSLARPGIRRALRLKGQVVNVVYANTGMGPPGMGVSFHELRTDETVRLRELIRELHGLEARVEPAPPLPREPRSIARAIERGVAIGGTGAAVRASGPKQLPVAFERQIVDQLREAKSTLSDLHARLTSIEAENATLKLEVKRLRARLQQDA